MLIFGFDVGGAKPMIGEITIEPSTTGYTVYAEDAGLDGFSPIFVNPVTATIDANITPYNIKSGVEILGVEGIVEELNAEQLHVTPTTSQQLLYPTSPRNGFDEVSVDAVTSSIDANIQSSNIKDGVTILGVTGSLTPGITPTGSLSITTNDTYDVTNYAQAVVNVPGGVNSKYGVTLGDFVGDTDVSGILQRPTNTINLVFTGVTNIQPQSLMHTFEENLFIRSVAFPNLTAIGSSSWFGAGAQCYRAFYQSGFSGAPFSVDMQYLTEINAADACKEMFGGAYIGSIDLSSLTDIDGYEACRAMFQYCNFLSSADLSSLTTISGTQVAQEMFSNTTALTQNLDLSSLTTIVGSSACNSMFRNSGITSVDMSGLTAVGDPLDPGTGNYAMYQMFAGCTSLTTADLSSLQAITGQSVCYQMFAYIGNSLTSVDLSGLTTINGGQACKEMFSCYDINRGLTSCNLSHLETIDGNQACYMMFDCTNIASMTFNSLESIEGFQACYYMFNECQNLTTVSFPALLSTGFGTDTTQFMGMLHGCSGVTVHFPSNLQAVIGSWSDVVGGFGGTNTTVLFDLPATN